MISGITVLRIEMADNNQTYSFTWNIADLTVILQEKQEHFLQRKS